MSEMTTLQRTVAGFVKEDGANGTGVDLEADLDEAFGRYRGRFAPGGGMGSGR